MGLINELQDSASSELTSEVLRKAKRVSFKLGRKDILKWLNDELKGYEGEVPSYRKIEGTVCLNFESAVPMGFGLLGKGTFPVPNFQSMPLPCRSSVSELENWLEQKKTTGGAIYSLPPPEAQQLIKSCIQMPGLHERQSSILLRIEESDVVRILSLDRDIILEWALKLEEAGVVGEDQTFKKDEIEKAQTVILQTYLDKVDQQYNEH